MKQKACGAVLIIILFLALDQALKIWVKTNMMLHDSIEITPWFYIFFTENPGMAFGIEVLSKPVLTLFRIIAAGFIALYLHTIIKKDYHFGYIVCISLIFVGAIGNIFDSIFYGVLFDHSVGQIATFMPPGGGYETWLHGKVVDMLYFPLINAVLPEWIPFWGGEEFVFFRPIFNLADSFICVGVCILFIFFHNTLSKSLSKQEKGTEEEKDDTEETV
ncbi:lipoprotein signal peptidase [Bacteroidia bacterium]|nr:lipoprotein signal peptidase [Bacteroidia bacterium]GHU54981.1 lipoprotein signal peptidase [Bacteroidia bacterium]GHU77078.1 lipoprotein signal peptidase [Bacteroidia bacterium]